VNQGKIAVVPFSESVTDKMIGEIFARFGPIREVRSRRNHGFVEYWDNRACEKVITAMHGTNLFGNRISVKLSRPYFRHILKAAVHGKRPPTVARTSRKANVLQLETRKAEAVPLLSHNRLENHEPKDKRSTFTNNTKFREK
jgi:RNA recognition motif-containing protein